MGGKERLALWLGVRVKLSRSCGGFDYFQGCVTGLVFQGVISLGDRWGGTGEDCGGEGQGEGCSWRGDQKKRPSFYVSWFLGGVSWASRGQLILKKKKDVVYCGGFMQSS